MAPQAVQLDYHLLAVSLGYNSIRGDTLPARFGSTVGIKFYVEGASAQNFNTDIRQWESIIPSIY